MLPKNNKYYLHHGMVQIYPKYVIEAKTKKMNKKAMIDN